MRKNIFLILIMTVFFVGCRGEIPMNNKISNLLEKQEQICYRFSKDDFNETLKIPEDIIVNVSTLENENHAISIRTASLNMDKFFYYCDKDGDDSYQCSGLDSIESLQLQLRNDDVSLHADYLQMFSNSESFLHRIKSKNSNFSKGIRASCYQSIKPIIEVKGVKKGSKKEKLLQSINMDDVIIYDLDFYEDFVVAVGEDNSPKTRAAQYVGYAYASLIIKSTNGGKTWVRVKTEDMTYNEHVVVLDNKSIVVSSFGEERGGAIEVSFDGGSKWKKVAKNGDIFVSLEHVGKEITASRETGAVVKSKDSGKNWEEIIPKRQKVMKVIPKQDTLAVLQTPIYKVDFETNNLTVKHSKEYFNCDSFTLPLIYNESNQKKGILGRYWSLGIESSITLYGSKELFYFDSSSGEEKLFIRDEIYKNRFLYNGSSLIKQTKNGYTKECGKLKQYFDKKGYLIKIEFKDKSYVVHYKERKIVKVEEFSNGEYRPYISILDSYEGVMVTFHQTKDKREITFLRNNDGLLSNIVEGNRHIFHYAYSEGEDRVLTQVDDNSKKYINPTILSFEFSDFGDKKSIVYDYTRRAEGIIEQKSYLHYAKEKEHICFVNTMKQTVKNGVIKDVKNSMNLYSFNYYDKNKKRLLSTQYKDQVYGFDKVGRVNFYANNDSNISIEFGQYNKTIKSIVNKKGKRFEYSYTYTEDKTHKVKTMTSFDGVIEFFYNEQNRIKESKIGKYHLKYEYNKNGLPTRIILLGRGEIITSYDENNEIISVQNKTYNDDVKPYTIARDISRAINILTKKASAGSIKKYPTWLW